MLPLDVEQHERHGPIEPRHAAAPAAGGAVSPRSRRTIDGFRGIGEKESG